MILLFSGCPEKKENVSFKLDRYPFLITYPATWRQIPTDNLFQIAQLSIPGKDGVFLVTANQDPDFLFYDKELFFKGLFLTTFRRAYPFFKLTDSRSVSIGKLDGLAFAMDSDSYHASGVLFLDGDVAISLMGITSEADRGILDKEFCGVFQSVRKTGGACPPDLSSIAGEKMTGERIRQTADYGRELLANRLVNVNNYNKAMEAFRQVLRATVKDPKYSEEHQNTLNLLLLAKTFRNQAFAEHRYYLEKHLGLRQKAMALEQADYLLSLVPDKASRRHRYVVAKYSQIYDIRQ